MPELQKSMPLNRRNSHKGKFKGKASKAKYIELPELNSKKN